MSENINGGCYDRLKREGNLNKTHFSYFGVPSVFLGSSLVLISPLVRTIISSLVFTTEATKQAQRKEILKIVLFHRYILQPPTGDGGDIRDDREGQFLLPQIVRVPTCT